MLMSHHPPWSGLCFAVDLAWMHFCADAFDLISADMPALVEMSGEADESVGLIHCVKVSPERRCMSHYCS